MTKFVVALIIMIVASIWLAHHLLTGESINEHHVAVGDCFNQAKQTYVACTSHDATFKIDGQSADATGAGCPQPATSIITYTEDTGPDTYWCVEPLMVGANS